MAPAHLDNPAGRLYHVLAALLESPPNTQIEAVLKSYLRQEHDPTHAELMMSVANIIGLVDEAVDSFTKINTITNTDLYLSWVGPAQEAVGSFANLYASVTSIQARFTHANLTALEFCADTLHNFRPELTLSNESLAEVLELLRQAIDAIESDESLPSEIRLHFATRLSDIEHAVRAYKITGYEGIERAIEELTGAIVLRPDVQQSSESTGFLRKIIAYLTFGATGVKAIEGIAESSEAIVEAVHQMQ